MSLDAILDQLNDFSIFGGIEAEALATVSDLFDCGSYPPGSCIIEEGDTGNRMYILTSGRVEVSLRCPPPRNSEVISTLGRGATIGEMELLDTQRRSATVTAIEPAETVELTNMGLLKIFQRDPDIFRMVVMNIARDLSRRLRAADQRLTKALGESPSQ